MAKKAAKSNERKILIIEDEPDVARIEQMILENEGYNIEIALGGKKGISKLKSKPDLVILDIRMPDISGRNVLEHMKKNRIKIPTIVVTAIGIPELVSRELSQKYPGIGFISKPRIYELLAKEVKRFLK